MWLKFTVLRNVLLLVILSLQGCADIPIQSGEPYQLREREPLYQLANWAFEGRLSVSDNKESLSASIEWIHAPHQDEIKLSGPLGQGAVIITLRDKRIVLDRGSDKIESSEDAHLFIEQQLGISIPMDALRYWVLGLPQPAIERQTLFDGFEQQKWRVHYLQMQKLAQGWLPRKLHVEHEEIKLKLVIDNWSLQ